jgi:hypothetical protein
MAEDGSAASGCRDEISSCPPSTSCCIDDLLL